MRVVVIGAAGFVGSAFVRHFRKRGDDVVEVTRSNYVQMTGTRGDFVVDAAGNSRKFWAEEEPYAEFDASVGHRLRTLRDFAGGVQVHISSVDVYDELSSPSTTREECAAIGEGSNYGFHKELAERLVRRYADAWLIVRLAGMLGPGLRKNPVFDILHGQPLRIHPDSRYQFIPTDSVAAITADLIDAGVRNDVFNVCGEGLISPREIAQLAGRELNSSAIPAEAQPRIVDIDVAKISQRIPLPRTVETVTAFVDRWNTRT